MAQNDEFRRKFAAFVERAKGNQEQVVRKVAIDLLTSLVMKSPVDTGRFRGNWFMQSGSPSTRTTGQVDTSGTSTIGLGSVQAFRFKMGDTIYITNHLPYAKRLEYGWSQQAPGGMVRITISEFDQYLTRAVGSLKK